MHTTTLSLTLACLISAILCADHSTSAQNLAPPEARPTPRAKVVAYVPNWIDLNTFSQSIDYAKITHLNLAFENPVDASGNLSFDPKDETLIAASHAHKIPLSLSIGGGSASSDKAMMARYFDLIAPAKRAGFVARIATYLSAHGFDGLDVDLEGPSINRDYGAFIADLSKALKPKGKLLTAALSQGYGGPDVPASVFAQFDWVNIMAYDGTGPWNPKEPGQHSSFELAKSSVEYWLQRGLPASKAVLGVPFYGYGFGEAFRDDEYSYAEIVAAFRGAENLDQVGKTIWHNGIPTIQAKARYAKKHGLGGVMIWSLNSDAKGKLSLLSALAEALAH